MNIVKYRVEIWSLEKIYLVNKLEKLILNMKVLGLVMVVVGVYGRCRNDQIDFVGDCLDCRYTNCRRCNGETCLECQQEGVERRTNCRICTEYGKILVNGKCLECQELGAILVGENCRCMVDDESELIDEGCCHPKSGATWIGNPRIGESIICLPCEAVSFGCEMCSWKSGGCTICKVGWRKVVRNRGDGPYAWCVPDEKWNPSLGRQLGNGSSLILILATISYLILNL